MKVLFIGGTGVISSASSQLCVERGHDLYLLNRGKSAAHRQIKGAQTIVCDIRDKEAAKQAIEGHYFDVVVDWIAFDPAHIKQDIELFKNKTDQFVFISSASAYQKPPIKLPITEDTPLHNPFWEYSRKKIACENLLLEAHEAFGFPYTIVRPSHTYDKTMLPIMGKYTALKRMEQGLPVVVHGDGTSLWTLTHHKDFAIGFVGLLGNKRAIGEDFHITSDEWLSWNAIYKSFARALNVEPNLVHLPSEVIATYDKEIGDSLLGDKSHCLIFDNSKIRKLVPEFNATIPFEQGALEMVNWIKDNKANLEINKELNALMDEMIRDYMKH